MACDGEFRHRSADYYFVPVTGSSFFSSRLRAMGPQRRLYNGIVGEGDSYFTGFPLPVTAKNSNALSIAFVRRFGICEIVMNVKDDPLTLR